jgi:hypothetical protein
MQKLFLLLILLIGLAGCAIGGNIVPREEVEAKYGPLPENYQQLVMAYAGTQLIDPDSARYQFFQPAPRSVGWVGQVYVNARNRFGGYTGNQLFVWKIIHGQAVFFAKDPTGIVW